MTPTPSIFNGSYSACADIVNFGNSPQARTVDTPDFNDLRFSELPVGVPFASHTSFSGFVPHIVIIGSQPKVSRG